MIIINSVELSKDTSENLIKYLSRKRETKLTEEELQFIIDSGVYRIARVQEQREELYCFSKRDVFRIPASSYYLQKHGEFYGREIWDNIAELIPGRDGIVFTVQMPCGFGNETL